ncbi:hypothetical protein [Deinococcus maricopensis]|uniref:Uncharacterized protein n=1 Tax=Deinococcus maricopensis (strain DSM 21211 / LMG 22137 / NRRL B-23946 / LB-34) TaxID=709986 RepID=E8U4I9_DEIML|nr:hypothetical protein [Deinococcus maricopensis]ADV68854.1 hypothetical protein Deima_3227 [Deinococcus maricopensis DSM 21211]
MLHNLLVWAVLATAPAMNSLLVDANPSPCLKVRVQTWEGDKRLSEVFLAPDGNHVVRPGETFPSFQKGHSYRLMASCFTAKGTQQSAGLDFKADGRTVIVAFTSNGFLFRRGGVAY